MKAKIYNITYIQEINILFALFNTPEVTMKQVLKIKHEKNAQRRINQTKLFIWQNSISAYKHISLKSLIKNLLYIYINQFFISLFFQ